MQIEDVIIQVKESLNETDQDPVLADWYFSLCSAKAFYGLELAKLKQARGPMKLEIKKEIIQENGKTSEAEVDSYYYATQEGKYDAYYSELLKHLSPLIEAIKIKRESLRH
jgi:hypothetical protein